MGRTVRYGLVSSNPRKKKKSRTPRFRVVEVVVMSKVYDGGGVQVPGILQTRSSQASRLFQSLVGPASWGIPPSPVNPPLGGPSEPLAGSRHPSLQVGEGGPNTIPSCLPSSSLGVILPRLPFLLLLVRCRRPNPLPNQDDGSS